MLDHLGTIFKLHRIEHRITLRKVAELGSVPASKLSDFENDKIKVPEQLLRNFYAIIDMKAKFYEDAYAVAEQLVLRLYHDIAFVRKTDRKNFETLLQNINHIQFQESYILFLLGCLIYYIYNHDEEFDYEKHIKIIERNEHILTLELKQIFYDTIGVYYKNIYRFDLAIQCFEKGIHLAISDTTLGMLLYHKTMVLTKICDLSDSLDCIKKSRKLFDDELNQKRSIMIGVQFGIIYSLMGKYDDAEKTYLYCLDAMKYNPVGGVMIFYNNLAWNSLRAGRYEKALTYAKEGSKISSQFAGSINFYRSYASWKLGRLDDAREYIKTAKNYKSGESDYMVSMIEGFSGFLSKNLDINKKENKLLRAYDETLKCKDLDLQYFVLSVIIELDFPKDQYEKQIAYRDTIIDLLQKRH